MKKRMLTAIIAGMLVLANGAPVLAAGMNVNSAYQDAELAIINQ